MGHCTESKQEMRGCLVDESHQADNYRGEFLGALGPLLLLRAAFMANPQVHCSHIRLELYCDNKGGVTHGNQVDAVLKADQVQADLIRLMKTYTRLIPAQLQWIHVHGHSDANTPFAQLTIIQQLNTQAFTVTSTIISRRRYDDKQRRQRSNRDDNRITTTIVATMLRATTQLNNGDGTTTNNDATG
eukprot:scaffold17820_cov42-Cyclotella_meneghiniana.AAC.3